jgi:hypothetical protein
MSAVLGAILAPLGSAAMAAAPVQMQPDGTLQIAGRTVQCGSIRNVLDPRLPTLGMASRRRNELILNPSRLNRYSSTVGLFVFHHECGHHHVGSDELAADCWALKRGLRDGWFDMRHIGLICRSFGNAPETDTHPAAEERCASLHRCFTAATGSKREAQSALRPDPAAFTGRRPLHAAPSPTPSIEAPPLPVGTLILVFVALVLAARPRRRSSRQPDLATATR